MKHKLLRILPFLLLGGVLGLAAVPAAFEAAGVRAIEDKKISLTPTEFNGKGSTSPGSAINITKDVVSLYVPKGYGTSEHLRVFAPQSYHSNFIELKCSAGTITQIDFTFTGSSNTGGYNASYTGLSTNDWKEYNSSQARITNIDIYISMGDVKASSLSVNTDGVTKTYTQGSQISYAGLKATLGLSNETNINLSKDQYVISPEEGTVLSDIGTTSVTVTYPGDSEIPTTDGNDLVETFDVTVTEAPTKATYTKVTSNSGLKAGDKVILVDTGRALAATKGLTGTEKAKHYLDREAVTIEGNNALFEPDSDICVFTLNAGSVSGSFALANEEGKYLAPYSLTDAGLKYETSITKASSWTIDLENITPKLSIKSNIENAEWDSLVYLMSNVDMRMYKSSSNCSPIDVYKYTSGNERVILEASAKDVYEDYTTTIEAEAVEFEPTSWSWESSNPAYVEVFGGDDSATVTIKGIAPGSSNLTVTANGKYKATCVVTCKSAGSLVIEPGDYFITDLTNKYMMGSDLSNVDDVDISKSENLYTFEFAGFGDGTYWVSNKDEKYLAFRQNIIPDGKRVSEMILTDEKVDYWTVSKNANNQYKVATDYNGTAKSIAQDGDLDWLAFSGDNYVNLTKQGTFKEFRIGHEPQQKKYYVGEKFNTTGLVVYAVFNVDGSEFLSDVTSKIVWDELVAGTEATGTYSSGDDSYVVKVEGLSILGPIVGSMQVTGLRDTYLIGEMPKETIEEVKVTYSDGDVEEVKTLEEADFIVSPDKVNSATTKILISMVDNPDVKYEKEITSAHAKYFATNMIEIGDKVTLGTTVGAKDGNITGGQEIAMVDGALKSQSFGYLPTPAMEFEVVQGVTAGTYAFKYGTSYLTSNGKTLDFGHVSNITGYKNENDTWSFDYPFILEGQSEPYYVHFDESQYTPGDFNGVAAEYSRNAWINATALMDDGLMLIGFDLYKPWDAVTPTHSEVELNYEINGGELIIYLPTSTKVDEKNSFTCTYVQSENDFMDDYWEICPVNEPTKRVYYNKDSGKFGVNANAEYNAMFYRDMTRDFSHEIKELKVSIPEGMPNTVVKNGTYNWVGITVKAVYDNTTKKLPLGAYEVDLPVFDTFGPKTCTVTYGTTNNKVTGTFTVYVKGNTQAFDVVCKDPILVGETYQASLANHYVPPVDEPITWSVSDTNLASIDQDGNVTGLKPGYVDVIATSCDGTYSDLEHIRIYQQVESVTLDKHEVTVNAGETYQLVATVLPEDASNKTVEYTSDHPEIAFVDEKTGLVTGVKEGTAVITCAAQNHPERNYDVCEVTVKPAPIVHVTGVELDCGSKNLAVKDTFILTAIVSPSNATVKNVTWSSDHDNIATVDQNGKVKGVAKGECHITATTADGGFKATCTVNVKNAVDPVPVISISLDITNKQISVDETFEIVATVLPANADDKGHINWETSDDSVAQVISAGPSSATIKGFKEGTATITATCGGKSATCKVTVGNPVSPVINVDSVSLNKTSINLIPGDESSLVATVNPSNATNKNVSWTSSNENVASVNANGRVIAVAAGEAIITVTTEDGGKTATCKVTVEGTPTPIVNVSSVSLNKTEMTLGVNEEEKLVATINPENATNKNVTWSTSNSSVVTVDENGNVKAVAKGEAFVMVKTEDGGKTALCKVTVQENPSPVVHVESVTLDKTEVELAKGTETVLIPTINPVTSNNKKVTWASSDTSIATVDQMGKVKAVEVGEATITVTTEDGGKTATCKITVTKAETKADPTPVIIGVSCGVGAVGIGCGVGIPLGVRAFRKRKLH